MAAGASTAVDLRFRGMSGAAMALSSISVVTNSLRLRRFRPAAVASA